MAGGEDRAAAGRRRCRRRARRRDRRGRRCSSRARGPSSSCLRSISLRAAQLVDGAVLRRRPSARRRGCPGRPARGQRSSAATSASCASSSARPTSRTMRARPAMSFACSMRQTASIACVGVGGHGLRLEQLRRLPQACVRPLSGRRGLLRRLPAICRVHHGRSSISKSVTPWSAWICSTRRAPAIASSWVA